MSPNHKSYLAVDLGAESGRVMSGQFNGRTITLQELHRFPNGPVWLGDTMRWNLVQLWSQIQTGLAKASAELSGPVASVGVDSWGVDFVLMNKHDELLGQPWHYRDSRTDGVMVTTFDRVPKAEIFATTGLQFMPINSLYQLIAMKQNDPGLVGQADVFLMIPDFFHWCLCGSRVVEFTNATTSQMLDATSRTWAGDLLRKLELPTQIFPTIVDPGTQLGTLRKYVATETGLGRLPVIAPATHDTGAAVAGVPTTSTGTANWAYISSGTWSLIGVEVQNAILTPKALQYNVTNEGGIDGTYRLLKNVMGLWLVQQCRAAFKRSGLDFSYEQMASLAAEAAAFRSLVDPNDERFLNPDNMPEAIAGYCQATSQPVPESPGQFIRCALESLALKYRQVLSHIEELTGETVQTIHIVGGGCQNELLNQFTASACGKTVVAGPIEATALGNVLVQLRADGEVSSLADMRQIVRNAGILGEFPPKDTAQWNEAYGRFEQLT